MLHLLAYILIRPVNYCVTSVTNENKRTHKRIIGTLLRLTRALLHIFSLKILATDLSSKYYPS